MPTLVHCSDLHLGFRQFQRMTSAGINQREADVARSFEQLVTRMIAIAPQIVVVAGDVFHSVRPANPAILHAFAQFARLAKALPETVIVIAAGNHDLPRMSETGCILRLFASLGVHVVDREAQRLAFPQFDLSVLAVPDVPTRRPELVPDPAARYNVLLLHGEVEGMLPIQWNSADRCALEISAEELGAARWTHVALGHYHVYRQIAPNVCYSGAIDYTSTNPWGELVEQREAGIAGKGFVVVDLASGSHRFEPLGGTRGFEELPAIAAAGLAPGEIDGQIRERVTNCAGGIDDKVVRLLVRDIPPQVVHALDHKTLRSYKQRALSFFLDTRRPEAARSVTSRAERTRRTLEEIVRENLELRPLEPDVDREKLVALGLGYLKEAEALDTPTSAVELHDNTQGERHEAA